MTSSTDYTFIKEGASVVPKSGALYTKILAAWPHNETDFAYFNSSVALKSTWKVFSVKDYGVIIQDTTDNELRLVKKESLDAVKVKELAGDRPYSVVCPGTPLARVLFKTYDEASAYLTAYRKLHEQMGFTREYQYNYLENVVYCAYKPHPNM